MTDMANGPQCPAYVQGECCPDVCARCGLTSAAHASAPRTTLMAINAPVAESSGPELTDAELEAIEARLLRALDGPFRDDYDFDALWLARADVPALVRELREARRTLTRNPCTICGLPIRDGAFIGDGQGTDVPEDQRFAHSSCYRGRDALARACAAEKRVAELERALDAAQRRGDEWQRACEEMGRHRDEWQEHAAEAVTRAEAAEKRCAELERVNGRLRDNAHSELRAERQEAIAERQRAEAACAHMRAALKFAHTWVKHRTLPNADGSEHADLARIDAALASDVGSGWVSPDVHAEVCRERDEWQKACEETGRHRDEWQEHAAEAVTRAEAAEKRCAELEAVLGDSADAGMEVRKLTVDSIARAEAAERRAANAAELRDEALGRAEKAEAAAAVMRERLVDALVLVPRSYPWHSKTTALLGVADAGKALAERVPLSDDVIAAAREALRLLNIALKFNPADRIGVAIARGDLDRAIDKLDAHDAQGKDGGR